MAGLEEGRSRAQADAREHMNEYGSMYDNAKETANALQAGYVKQMQKISGVLTMMRQLPLKKCAEIEPGCVVVAMQGAFFISTGLIEKSLEVDGTRYDCVNINAPIVQKLRQGGWKRIF